MCGISIPDNDVVCWGEEVGDGDSGPGFLTLEGDYTSISTGDRHVCALRDDGKADCYGNTGVFCGFYERCEVSPPSVKFSSIVSGGQHACALRESDSRASCWTWRHKNSGRDEILAVP